MITFVPREVPPRYLCVWGATLQTTSSNLVHQVRGLCVLYDPKLTFLPSCLTPTLSLSLSLFLCVSLPHIDTHTRTHTVSHTYTHILSHSLSGQWRNNTGLALDPTVTQSSPSSPSLLTSLLTDYSPITTTTTVPQCQLCPDGTHKSVR